MENCKECKENAQIPQQSKDELAFAFMERMVKRLWITIILLIVMLVGTNGAWIWYEIQFSDIVTTIEAEQDGSGVNIVSGGNLDYGAESRGNNP